MSLEEAVQEDIRDTNLLINDIVSHAGNKERKMTKKDLINYNNRGEKLGNRKEYTYALIEGKLSYKVEAMIAVLHSIMKAMNILNEEKVSDPFRKFLVNYEETYRELRQ